MPRIPNIPGPHPRVHKKSAIDFDKLRKERDEEHERIVRKVCEEQGWDFNSVVVHISHSTDCYCACPNGPCEHDFTGPVIEIEGGACITKTCWKCKGTAFHHDLRVW